jgi:hypothetical protein
MDMHTDTRRRLGLPNVSQEYTVIRERWATLTNDALREANIEARVDHRSLEAQGIDREPRPRIPFAAYQIDQKGERSEVAERLRQDHSARVEARIHARLDRAAEPGRDQAAGPPAPPIERPTEPPQTLEDIRREARESWLRMRAGKSGALGQAASREQPRSQEHTDTRSRETHGGQEPDDDYST